MAICLCYERCTTCKRALKWLDEHKVSYSKRDIKNDNPSYKELRSWYEMSGLPIKRFFNTSGNAYKDLALKDRLPSMSDEEALKLLSGNGMLVKRPLFIDDDKVLVGFKEAEWEAHFTKDW